MVFLRISVQVSQTGCGQKEDMKTNCDCCAFYEYDEEDESYSCAVNLDEDEMYRFLTGTNECCPYFRSGDEYAVVRHQM